MKSLRKLMEVRRNQSGTVYPCSTAAALAVLALICLCAGCNQKPTRKTKDFSKTNSVVALLGEAGKLHGNGLEHAHWQVDGLTSPTTVDGVPCRQIEPGRASTGYLYFIIDQTFKKGNVKNVKIEVEYFDAREVDLALHYDATGVRTNSDAAYTKSPQTFRLTGSKTWQTVAFHVRGAAFKNAQNAGSDFRLRVRPAEFYVRKVTVTREGM